ncbi:hypothetical protein VXE29_15760 [Acinetobacter variabilis]|uniref:hypothetical protein n=1 Tax=Acinetobacter variabilis TaxID=70346 RepID=UPI0030FB295B
MTLSLKSFEYPMFLLFYIFKYLAIGKRVLLQSGIEVDLNLDGRIFYTSLNQLFKLNHKVI